MPKIENQMVDVLFSVQRKTGYKFDPDEVYEIARYTLRKCQVNGMGDDYAPILFENELRDYLSRKAINMKGALKNVFDMPAVAV